VPAHESKALDDVSLERRRTVSCGGGAAADAARDAAAVGVPLVMNEPRGIVVFIVAVGVLSVGGKGEQTPCAQPGGETWKPSFASQEEIARYQSTSQARRRQGSKMLEYPTIIQ
jgi:hypothetical protein